MTNEESRHPAPWGEEDGESLSVDQLRRYLEAPLRRPWLLVGPWIAVFLMSVVALWILPKKYVSSTLILVESEKVPASFVPRVTTEDSRGGLETVREEVLSRTRIEKVLAETNPYPDIDSLTRAVEELREATMIRVSGRDGFKVEFMHRDPQKAQAVTERLTTLFIEESVSARERQVEEAIEFLNAQVEEARRELDAKDAAVRRYKESRMGRLPEQLDSNLATLDMLQRELQTVEENVIFTRTRQETLARNVGRPGTPQGSGSGAPSQLERELAKLQRDLAELRGRYTNEHPEIQTLVARIRRIEAQAAGTAQEEEPVPDPQLTASSLLAEEQLQRATAEIQKLELRQADLEQRIARMRARVEDTPRTVQELESLNRDYKKLNENYQTLLSKQLDAQMAGRLEERWKGERFRVLDPAFLPEKPYSPRPAKVLILGAVAGLFVGLGACLAAEFLDSTIKDPEELAAIGGFPVLASIPHLQTRER